MVSFTSDLHMFLKLHNGSLLPGGATDHQDSFVLTSAPLERITEEQTTVHCWKTMYNLLELYSTMPTTKTVQRHSLTPMTSSSMLDAGILLRAGRSFKTSSNFHF